MSLTLQLAHFPVFGVAPVGAQKIDRPHPTRHFSYAGAKKPLKASGSGKFTPWRPWGSGHGSLCTFAEPAKRHPTETGKAERSLDSRSNFRILEIMDLDFGLNM